jgi:hypothetical protein
MPRLSFKGCLNAPFIKVEHYRDNTYLKVIRTNLNDYELNKLTNLITYLTDKYHSRIKLEPKKIIIKKENNIQLEKFKKIIINK